MSTPIYTPDGFTFVSIDDRGVTLWVDTDGSYWSTSVEDSRPILCSFGPYGWGYGRNRRGKTIAR